MRHDESRRRVAGWHLHDVTHSSRYLARMTVNVAVRLRVAFRSKSIGVPVRRYRPSASALLPSRPENATRSRPPCMYRAKLPALTKRVQRFRWRRPIEAKSRAPALQPRVFAEVSGMAVERIGLARSSVENRRCASHRRVQIRQRLPSS
jgi:hypothetical protein